MKRLLLILLALTLLLTGCGEPDSTPGEGVSVYEYWLAEEFGDSVKPDKNGAYTDDRQMYIYDAYYLAPQDWLIFAPTITNDGYQCQLFRLTGNDLQTLCRWPGLGEGDFTFDEWGFSSAYLPEQGICAMYNPYRQQYYLYDVAAETGRQIQLPLPANLPVEQRDVEAVCLTDNLFLFGRELTKGRVSLSLYDLAADSEQPLAEMNGRWIQNYYQLEPGLWLMMTNAGDLFELKLDMDGAQIQNLYNCPEEWPTGETEEYYNRMQIIPNTEGVRVLLSVFGDENMVYQVIDWQAGAEIGRYALPQHLTDETGQLLANDAELLGAQGDFMYFPLYVVEGDNYYLHLQAYNYLTGGETEVFNNRSQRKPRQTWFYQGFCSPDGRQLLLCSYRDIWSLPLAEMTAAAADLISGQGASGAYSFDRNSGALELTEDGRTCRLGVLAPLIWQDAERGASWQKLDSFTVRPTPAGNYLFVGEGVGSGTLSFHYQLAALVPAAGGEAQTYLAAEIVDPLPEPFWQGDNLWLADEDGPVCINDRTGEAVQYKLYFADQRLGGYCWWADERLLLLGGSGGFFCYDRQSEKLLELNSLLLTDELKGQLNELLRANDPRAYPDESSFDYVWQNFGNTLLRGTTDPVPYLNYVSEQDGVFNFELCCHYYSKSKNSTDIARFPLTIGIEQIEELMQ